MRKGISSIWLPRLVLAGMVSSALAMAGCSYDMSNLLSSGSGDSGASDGVNAVRLQPTSEKVVSATVAYRPAIGPPDDVGRELSRQLNDAALEQGLALVIDPNIKSDVSMRGYVTALRKGNTVNITYLWDVLDASGKRVHRIAGEEALANGVDVKQPWAAVSPAVSRMIALKTMSELGQWTRTNAASRPREGIASSGTTLVPRPAGAGVGTIAQ